MEREGPVLESLTRRLAETPQDFLAEPRIGSRGKVETAAVIGDLLRQLGSDATADQLKVFVSLHPPLTPVDSALYGERNSRSLAVAHLDRNRFAVALILCWLLADDWFKQARLDLQRLLRLLGNDAIELAAQTASNRFVTDPDRREELVRVTLAKLGFRPAGETLAQAQDRLTTLNSAERARVMQAARAAEERARQIREALAKKAAEESADKWTRE